MPPRGFEENQAEYKSGDPRGLVGQIRRLGPAGPAYEIMKVSENGDVLIEVVVSGEQVVFKLEEVQEDPMAETIP